MQLEAVVLLQPGLHVGRLVSGVVVEDQVHFALPRHGPVDAAEELQELLRPVAGMTCVAKGPY